MLLASPVWSLSCLPPDAVFLYQEAREDKAGYYIVKGKVTLTEPANRPDPSDTKRTRTLTKARATGVALTKTGFKVKFDRPIVIEASCVASWCGGPGGLDRHTHIFALRIDGNKLILRQGPCGGMVVPWSKDQEKRLMECHLKGTCVRNGY